MGWGWPKDLEGRAWDLGSTPTCSASFSTSSTQPAPTATAAPTRQGSQQNSKAALRRQPNDQLVTLLAGESVEFMLQRYAAGAAGAVQGFEEL